MALQPVTGFASTVRAPAVVAEIDFNQGPSTASAGQRTACYVGCMSSSGTATVNQVYDIRSEGYASQLAGPGSPAHRALRMHFKVNKTGRVYAVFYAATSGGTPVAATGTITITFSSGTNPDAAGTHVTYICGERIETGYSTSDTVTTIAAAIAANVNARTWLPVTAANVAGVVTLTAKVAGTSQGDGTVGVIRFRSLDDSGTVVTTTDSGAALGLGTGAAGAEGSTTENTNFAAALAVVANARYYYMGSTTWSSTNQASFQSHMDTKSAPIPGLRSRAFVGYPHTLAGAQALAISRNNDRFHIACQPNSEHDAAELAAWALARHQQYEASDTVTILDGDRSTALLAAYDSSDWPSFQDKDDAVTDGVMLIGSDQFGATLTMSVNTRSKDSTGTYDDFRSTETHRVSVMDELVDTVLTRWAVQYTSEGFKLTDDQYLSDGVTVNPNQVLPAKTLTPSTVKPFVGRILGEFADAGKIQKLDDWLDALRVNLDPNNVARLEFGDGGRTIDVLHQASILLSETSPG